MLAKLTLCLCHLSDHISNGSDAILFILSLYVFRTFAIRHCVSVRLYSLKLNTFIDILNCSTCGQSSGADFGLLVIIVRQNV